MRRLSRNVFFAAAALAVTSNAQKISFNRDVRPILAEHCYTCHGPDAEGRKAGLRLDERASALHSTNGRPAIVPGKPEKSELIRRVMSRDEKLRMPFAPAPPLPAPKVETLRRWIEQGAEYEPHWSWTKLTRPDVPKVNDAAWPASDLDRLLLAKLEAAGLAPASDADRETLLRRISIDLTGLPPSVEELEQFLADTSPEAWSKTVDQVLADATLKRPADEFMMTGGRKGLHSEHMGFILAEMQHVTRAYPDVSW